jgi:NADH-quinone oxidoreductase subunit C
VTPEEIGPRLVEVIGAGEASVSAGSGYARAVVDVPPSSWTEAATLARDDESLALTFFDWLSGVDAGESGLQIVAHLWSVPLRHGVLLRTTVTRESARLASLVPVFPGAAWHERETFEMFGVVFDGHPDLKKLLLPDEFEGNPLRKEFVLAARVAKSWPGAKEPGESDSGAPSRRRIRPPGVPDPNEWGPDAGKLPAEEPERPARRAPGDRPARAARDAGDRPARRTPPAERPAMAGRAEPSVEGTAEPRPADAPARPAPEESAEPPARPASDESAEPPARAAPEKPGEGGEG